MDISTGLTILGTAVGSVKLIEKILGPTADYLGNGLRDYSKKRIENIAKIFFNASKKLGDTIDNQSSVPPRVLKKIIDEASFCDDKISLEYFGGVLASSKSDICRDDRAVSYLELLDRLSSYSIRLHYILYTIVRRLFLTQNIEIGVRKCCREIWIYIPKDVIYQSMDFSENETRNWWYLLTDAFNGLTREFLVDLDKYGLGQADWLREFYVNPDEYHLVTQPGLIFSPSSFGVELYMWAHGFSNFHVEDVLSPNFHFNALEDIDINKGCKTLTRLINNEE